jgi:sulfide dehydrogenase cytochrome subunit
MKTHNVCKLTALLIFAASVSQAADINAIANSCNDCHGKDGVSEWPEVPTIAGMPEVVHADALYIYADGDRPCSESKFRQGDTSRPATTMCKIASELSDDDKDGLAAHYANLPFVAAKQEFDPALASAGEAIHKSECDRCHSDGGSNPDDEAGILAGQWMAYLEASFAEYSSGEREQPAKMQEKIDALGADDIKALLHYYASQQ